MQKNIKVIKENKTVVHPLLPLQSFVWQVIKSDITFQLINPKLRVSLSQIYENVNYSIIFINHRENYTIYNQAMSNFSTRLGIIDGQILSKLQDLKEKLDKILIELKDLHI